MTASISNKKRSREDDGVREDHMPLSKRINMLNINNNYNVDSNNHQLPHNHNNLGIMPTVSAQSTNYMNSNGHDDNHHSTNHNGHNQMHHHNSHTDHHIPTSSHEQHHHHHHHHDIEAVEDSSTYNPELTQIENPYYYNKNKLLFELHLERNKRSK